LDNKPDDHPNWWVDSSYAIHPDEKCHSGIFMLLGNGATCSTSCKQKPNNKSLTEAKIVAKFLHENTARLLKSKKKNRVHYQSSEMIASFKLESFKMEAC